MLQTASVVLKKQLPKKVFFLDFGIFIYGPFEYPSFVIKLAANAPHLTLGGFALFSGLKWGKTA